LYVWIYNVSKIINVKLHFTLDQSINHLI